MTGAAAVPRGSPDITYDPIIRKSKIVIRKSLHMRTLCLRFLLSALFIATALTLGDLRAGGPLGAFGDRPMVWDIEGSGPVLLRLDRGGLGQFDSAGAYGIIMQAITAWDTISGSILAIEIEGYFDHDITSATDPDAFSSAANSDGIVPVVIDDDGSITDAFFGAGASNQILGFATPFSNNQGVYFDGRIVLNGSNKNRNEGSLVRTMTHETGHLLGLSHTQRSLRAEYVLMNPFSGTMDEDDFLAIVRLYPDENALSDRGTISGFLRDPEGAPISGANVIAVDSATGRAYATLSDYFSGPDGRFGGPNVPKTGFYEFRSLPAGNYFIKIEPINVEWIGGSSVGSYDPPENTGMVSEWYNGGNESGAMHLDNINERIGVPIVAGTTVENVNIVHNDTTGLKWIGETSSGTSRSYAVPQGYQGVSADAYAVRFRAPETGSPVMVRFYVSAFPALSQDQNVVVTVHRNATTSGADVPGTAIGSVVVPYGQISAGLPNDVWLHTISGLNFVSGDIFHVSIALDGPGRLNMEFYDGAESEGTSYFRRSDQEWIPFPIEGNNGGLRRGRLRMEAVYSKIRPGDQRVLTAVEPDPMQFSPTEIGTISTRKFRVASIGTVPYTLDQFVITGGDLDNFRIEPSVALPLIIEPGTYREFEAVFLPEEERNHTATLEVTGTITTTHQLLGTGTFSSVEQLVNGIEFGEQEVNSSRQIDTIVIHNRGDVALVAQPIDFADAGFRLISPKSDGFFRPGEFLTVVIAFEPTERREYSSSFGFSFRPDRDTVRIPVTGVGVDSTMSVASGSLLQRGWSFSVRESRVTAELAVTLSHSARRITSAVGLLYDMEGREVERVEGERTGSGWRGTFKLEALPSGAYRLVVVTSEGVVSRGVRVTR